MAKHNAIPSDSDLELFHLLDNLASPPHSINTPSYSSPSQPTPHQDIATYQFETPISEQAAPPFQDVAEPTLFVNDAFHPFHHAPPSFNHYHHHREFDIPVVYPHQALRHQHPAHYHQEELSTTTTTPTPTPTYHPHHRQAQVTRPRTHIMNSTITPQEAAWVAYKNRLTLLSGARAKEDDARKMAYLAKMADGEELDEEVVAAEESSIRAQRLDQDIREAGIFKDALAAVFQTATTTTTTSAPGQHQVQAAPPNPRARPGYTLAAVPRKASIVEFPKNSGVWVVLECPICDRVMDSPAGMYHHMNQNNVAHRALLDTDRGFVGAARLSSRVVGDADRGGVDAHMARRAAGV